MSVNKVILIGNLGNDPEIKYLPSGEPVANFSVATSEVWNDKNTGEKREKTEWHRISAFRKLAEIIGQMCRKGTKVYIEGRLQTRSWTDPSGQTRYITEVLAETVQILSNKTMNEQPYDYGQNNHYGQPQTPYQPPQNNYQNGGGYQQGNNPPPYSPPNNTYSAPSNNQDNNNPNSGFPSDSDIPF